jgi:heparosan-N-sulfate-glucuronate 5-epimerase
MKSINVTTRTRRGCAPDGDDRLMSGSMLGRLADTADVGARRYAQTVDDEANDRAPRGRSQASFFSSVASFSLPEGAHVTPGAVRGYYIDMGIKAETPDWPPPGMPAAELRLHVATIQWALGAYEHYLAGEGDAWLAVALKCAEELLGEQEASGSLAGGWVHARPFPHTFALRPPWLSAMSQGEGASLMVRMYAETGDERYAQAARRALLPLKLDAADGGVRAALNGRAFPEEYPTSPPSFVLNGGMFAMWGLHDVGVGLAEPEVLSDFELAVDTLAGNLDSWDLGYWSRYDLFPHPVPNVASSFYHDLHVKQLRMTNLLAPRPQLAAGAERWAAYADSAFNRRRAFAGKALFRLVVPRNRALARRLPWSTIDGSEEAQVVRKPRSAR